MAVGCHDTCTAVAFASVFASLLLLRAGLQAVFVFLRVGLRVKIRASRVGIQKIIPVRDPSMVWRRLQAGA